jgi:hypothetical protein
MRLVGIYRIIAPALNYEYPEPRYESMYVVRK